MRIHMFASYSLCCRFSVHIQEVYIYTCSVFIPSLEVEDALYTFSMIEDENKIYFELKPFFLCTLLRQFF